MPSRNFTEEKELRSAGELKKSGLFDDLDSLFDTTSTMRDDYRTYAAWFEKEILPQLNACRKPPFKG